MPMDLISAFQNNMKDLPSVMARTDNPANPEYVKPIPEDIEKDSGE